MTIIETSIEELMAGAKVGACAGMEATLEPPTQSASSPGRGRDLIPLEVEFVRELERKDLSLPPDPGQTVPVHVKSLRDRHHDLARSIARGDMSYSEIAKKHGYTQARISVLMSDPAFLDLVEQYRGEVHEIFRGSQERLADIMREASDILLERMDENADSFTNNQLLEVIKMAADRTGHGATTTQKVEGTIVHATREGIEAIKNRVQERQNGQANRINQEIIEVKAEEVGREPSHQPLTIPEDRGTQAGEVLDFGSEMFRKESEIERGASER